MTPGASPRIVLAHLPVYPSRLTRAAGGGYWLTAFTARTQLIEFVLREPAYRRRMMTEIDPAYWGCPRACAQASRSRSRCRARTSRPWASSSRGRRRDPTDIVIRLNPDGQPLYSLHSRVDGVNHGIVAAHRDGATTSS
ncbi:hypothetical protein BRDID11002_20600 [Bradyrhizobium diazoefficiens]